MERFALDSSTIKGAGYGEGHLVVEFNNGNLYAYPMEHGEFLKFAEAESKGRYFNTAIRGRFQGVKLTGKCRECGAVGVLVVACEKCGGDVLEVDRIHKEQA